MQWKINKFLQQQQQQKKEEGKNEQLNFTNQIGYI